MKDLGSFLGLRPFLCEREIPSLHNLSIHFCASGICSEMWEFRNRLSGRKIDCPPSFGDWGGRFGNQPFVV